MTYNTVIQIDINTALVCSINISGEASWPSE